MFVCVCVCLEANSYSNLMEGVVKIIPFDQCSSPDVYGSEVRSGMLCAGRESCVDACQVRRQNNTKTTFVMLFFYYVYWIEDLDFMWHTSNNFTFYFRLIFIFV